VTFAVLVLISCLLGPANATSSVARPLEMSARPTTLARTVPDVFEGRVARRINAVRAAHGRRPLSSEACTDGAAERWSRRLEDADSFVHQSMSHVLDLCHATYAGEVLAKGVLTPRLVVRLWMQSPGHRRVLLSSSPRRIGIAAEPQAGGVWLVVVDVTRL
jgi:uncharacterized protein YkwD